MNEQDFAWLSRAARDLCAGDTLSPEDLLAAALGRYLAGVRKWNDRVSLRTQLYSAMRSIVSSWRKSRARAPKVESLDELLEHADASGDESGLPPSLGAEREARFEQLLQVIGSAFPDDEVAKDVLGGMASGMSPGEIQECLGITPTTYASVQTRIRRQFAKLRAAGELQ
ncbi:hypothetical protein [Lysobacter sp. FW306-1B-D06B]|uniref:RNA polymerase sigma factor n=1 Tax=Lysobacter sp. FW306-1B-D06B TaxID=3140250 RepID=UPI0031408924